MKWEWKWTKWHRQNGTDKNWYRFKFFKQYSASRNSGNLVKAEFVLIKLNFHQSRLHLQYDYEYNYDQSRLPRAIWFCHQSRLHWIYNFSLIPLPIFPVPLILSKRFFYQSCFHWQYVFGNPVSLTISYYYFLSKYHFHPRYDSIHSFNILLFVKISKTISQLTQPQVGFTRNFKSTYG